MFKNMNTERASYFTERSYTTSEAENKKDIFEYWKKILGEDTLRVAEKCYGIDLVKVLNSENYVCENNHVMSEMEKVKIELFEKPINYNYSGFKGEKLAFDNFFIPLINYGIDILKNGTSLFWTDSIIDTYANTLLERLGKISLGILMFEMYLCKKTGKLNGRNSEEEYDYYNNNFLSKKSYKQELFNIYPCLLRSVTETVENLSSYYVLLLERLNKDKNEIANKFCGGLEFKNVVEISSNISDSHKKGNGVSILKLDNGTKIVYKPRSLKIEKVYFDFLGKINAGCKYEMYEPKILDCQEYGWEEFVYYKSCKTEDEIRRYFYRFGILIFGSYILNTNDLHEENVIAAGEYPIIIDAETILDNRRRGRTNSAKEEINYILHESVLYSGLLPHYRFSNLGQQFKDKTAVDDVSLTLTTGVWGLLGANGAGKTTLMRILADIMTPSSGRISLDGKDIHKMGADYRNIFGFLPQDFGYSRDFTVKDYLEYVAALKDVPLRETTKKINYLLDILTLSDVKRKKIAQLSGGMKRRVGIAQAMLNDPKILVMDEPTAGLDPGERVRFRNFISEFSHDRIVLISTHIVSDIEYIATRNAIMKAGKIIDVGTTSDLVKQIEGKVWSCAIPAHKMMDYEMRLRIINQRGEDNNQISIRYLAEHSEVEGSILAEPRLEDLYLWLFPQEDVEREEK